VVEAAKDRVERQVKMAARSLMLEPFEFVVSGGIV
jgi:hypothetical protein